MTKVLFYFLVASSFLFGQSDAPRVYFPTRDATNTQRAKLNGVRSLQTPNSNIPQGHGIAYNGGSLMLGTVNVYLIFYGNWTNNTGPAILTDLVSNLANSPYMNINTSYYDSSINRPANSIHFAGLYYDVYTQGSSNINPQLAVQNAVDSGKIGPADSNAVYFVLTSRDVFMDGLGINFCGWHSFASINGTDVKYALIGNNGSTSYSCAAQQGVSPNSNPEVDAMASIILHELSESITDPHVDAWHNTGNSENADKCAWTYGTENRAGNGSYSNVRFGSRSFLIQQNWVNDGETGCSMEWPAPVPTIPIKIVSAADSTQCLEITGTTIGALLQQNTCVNTDNQKFVFHHYGSGYKISSILSNHSLDVSGGVNSKNDGNSIIQWSFSGNYNQIWSVGSVGALFTISAFNSARSITADGGLGVSQGTYASGMNQKWNIVVAP